MLNIESDSLQTQTVSRQHICSIVINRIMLYRFVGQNTQCIATEFCHVELNTVRRHLNYIIKRWLPLVVMWTITSIQVQFNGFHTSSLVNTGASSSSSSNTATAVTCPDVDATLDLHTSSCYESLLTPLSNSEATSPVIGLPGPFFTLIHGVALFSLSTTILVTCSLLVFLCACRKERRHQQKKQKHFKDSDTSQPTATDPRRDDAPSAGHGRSPLSTSVKDNYSKDADRVTASERAAR